MGAPYLDPHERARKIAHSVRAAVQGSSQVAIAAAIGVSESTVSRLLAEHLDNVSAIVAHAGLKIVPGELVCVPEPTYQEMRRIVGRAYANEQAAREIILGETE